MPKYARSPKGQAVVHSQGAPRVHQPRQISYPSFDVSKSDHISLPTIIITTIIPPLVVSVIHTITEAVKGAVDAVAEALDVADALAKVLRHVLGDILYAVDGPVPAVFEVLGYVFYVLDLWKRKSITS